MYRLPVVVDDAVDCFQMTRSRSQILTGAHASTALFPRQQYDSADRIIQFKIWNTNRYLLW
jgi:hypothetical protein